MSGKTISAVELEAQHEAALAAKREKLSKLNDELASLAEDEAALRAEFLMSNPEGRSDRVGLPVTETLRKLEKKSRERDLLQRDLAAQEAILEDLHQQAAEERGARELAEAKDAIKEAENALREKWESFKIACEDTRLAWADVAEAASALDALPAGECPVTPLPSNIAEGFKRVLNEPGQDPFATEPRIVARRLSTVGGSAATDTRGFAHTLRQLGDWQ